MAHLFWLASATVFSLVGVGAYYWPPTLALLIVLLPLFVIGVSDTIQTRHAVKRNFPVIGHLRYLFEMIRPELQQYFVESNHSGRPISREDRSVVYQRAKGQMETLPFGTQKDYQEENHEWVHHSMVPRKIDESEFHTRIGGKDCKHPYNAKLLNISAMSYGSLSKRAISALNQGAAKGGFYHNTGEGGISPYHKSGGDLVWQIGTGYFGCRNERGQFSEELFAEKAQWDCVKMIELKLSQGAKPGKGGILPGEKVTAEIAEIRHVEVGKSVLSPAHHSAFSSPKELVAFVKKLRELSGGKPVGFKLCVGRRSEFFAVCRAMIEENCYPDFISVDGGEGGTGAAPLEFTNWIGDPLAEGLSFVDNTLKGFGIRDEIKLIASGRIFNGFDMVKAFSLGADACSSARGMMLALGCIQALKCNSNHCPVGVATTNPKLYRGLHVPSKAERVARYQAETVHAFAQMLGAMGYTHYSQIRRRDIFRRLTGGRISSFEELYPSTPHGALTDLAFIDNLPASEKADLVGSQSTAF